MSKQFNVGDRVVATTSVGHKGISGAIGTVRYVEDHTTLVEFDQNIGGHDGNGLVGVELDSERGWYIAQCYLEAAPEPVELKKGDRVIGLKSDYDGDKLVGKTGVIVLGDNRGGYSVRFDPPFDGHGDDGRRWFCLRNEIEPLFELEEPEEYGTFIVVVDKDNGLRPATRPYVHTVRQDAVHEAERLAVQNPEMDFLVFRAVSKSRTTKPADITVSL